MCCLNRRLHKSAPLECESAQAAEKAVALLQRQAAINHRKGAASPAVRRLLVILNPHSGQGMCAAISICWAQHWSLCACTADNKAAMWSY